MWALLTITASSSRGANPELRSPSVLLLQLTMGQRTDGSGHKSMGTCFQQCLCGCLAERNPPLQCRNISPGMQLQMRDQSREWVTGVCLYVLHGRAARQKVVGKSSHTMWEVWAVKIFSQGMFLFVSMNLGCIGTTVWGRASPDWAPSKGWWFSGHGVDELVVEPDDRKDLFQPSWFYDSVSCPKELHWAEQKKTSSCVLQQHFKAEGKQYNHPVCSHGEKKLLFAFCMLGFFLHCCQAVCCFIFLNFGNW